MKLFAWMWLGIAALNAIAGQSLLAALCLVNAVLWRMLAGDRL